MLTAILVLFSGLCSAVVGLVVGYRLNARLQLSQRRAAFYIDLKNKAYVPLYRMLLGIQQMLDEQPNCTTITLEGPDPQGWRPRASPSVWAGLKKEETYLFLPAEISDAMDAVVRAAGQHRAALEADPQELDKLRTNTGWAPSARVTEAWGNMRLPVQRAITLVVAEMAKITAKWEGVTGLEGGGP